MLHLLGTLFILGMIIVLVRDLMGDKQSAEMKRFLHGHTGVKREEAHTDSSWDPFWRLDVPSGEDKIDDTNWNDNWIDPKVGK
jgi:hypothetical protein